MRLSLFGGLVAIGFMMAATDTVSPPHLVHAQTDDFRTGWHGGLITHFYANEGFPHTLTVVDPSRHVVGVYHVDASSGEISLKSVRNLTWDLQLPEFNSGSPSPQDIRNGLQQVR